MSGNPKLIEVIARAVCIREGCILLCHGKGKANTYLPGGHIEYNESAEEALIRELVEELGQKAKIRYFLGAVEHTFTSKGKRCCEINLVFQVDIPSIADSTHPRSCEDHIEFLWHPLNKLDTSKLEPFVLTKVVPAWLHNPTPSAWSSTYRR